MLWMMDHVAVEVILFVVNKGVRDWFPVRSLAMESFFVDWEIKTEQYLNFCDEKTL